MWCSVVTPAISSALNSCRCWTIPRRPTLARDSCTYERAEGFAWLAEVKLHVPAWSSAVCVNAHTRSYLQEIVAQLCAKECSVRCLRAGR